VPTDDLNKIQELKKDRGEKELNSEQFTRRTGPECILFYDCNPDIKGWIENSKVKGEA